MVHNEGWETKSNQSTSHSEGCSMYSYYHVEVIWADEGSIVSDLLLSSFFPYSPPIQSNLHQIPLCSLLSCTPSKTPQSYCQSSNTHS